MQWWVLLVSLVSGGVVAYAVWLCVQIRRQTLVLARSYQAVMRGSMDAIVLEDSKGRITHWSPGAQALFGYSADEMRGRTRQCLIPPEQAGQEDRVLSQLTDQVKSMATTRVSRAGVAIPVTATYTAIMDEQGKHAGMCCVMRDSQRQHLADELIRSMSFNDALTGLPNWRLLRDRLWRAQLHSGRQRTYFAVLYIDLDDFKAVNDQHGVDAGSQLLIEVGARLMAAVRQKDTVARLVADEFVVLLEDLGSDEFHARNRANAVADKILDLMEGRSFKLGDAQVQCSASIGIQVVQGGNGHVDQIVKQADAAMARVKQGRRMVARGDYAGKASG